MAQWDSFECAICCIVQMGKKQEEWARLDVSPSAFALRALLDLSPRCGREHVRRRRAASRRHKSCATPRLYFVFSYRSPLKMRSFNRDLAVYLLTLLVEVVFCQSIRIASRYSRAIVGIFTIFLFDVCPQCGRRVSLFSYFLPKVLGIR